MGYASKMEEDDSRGPFSLFRWFGPSAPLLGHQHGLGQCLLMVSQPVADQGPWSIG